MGLFYNAETTEPVKTMYISSSGKGNVVVKSPGRTGTGMMSQRIRPVVEVANGPGEAKPDPGMDPGPGDFRWIFTGLREGSSIVAYDSNMKILEQIEVKLVHKLGSYKEVNRRLGRRGMKIDLDDHIDYVCYGSEMINEGIHFRPKDGKAFREIIENTQLFHHDDRGDHFGKAAASATIGEGYREVSTPSLHVAVADHLASVHIDAHAFMIYGPNGNGTVISPDVGQHIFDELLFRLPMTWLRKKDLPFLASVLHTLHPILPNSSNLYSPKLGLRFELGGSKTRDMRNGMPRFRFESTVNFGRGVKDRVRHEATLRLLHGGNVNRAPDWTLSLKADASCLCKEPEGTVGLWFTAGKM